MAAPETEKTEQASKIAETAPVEAAAPAPAPAAPPLRRKRGFVSKLLVSASLLAVLLGAAGYGAIAFKDKDPRIALAASYVEQGVDEAQEALDKAQAVVAELTGSPKPAKTPGSRHALLDKAPLPASSEPTPPAAEAPPPSVAATPIEAPKAPEKPVVAEPLAEKPDTPPPPPPSQPQPVAEPAIKPAAPVERAPAAAPSVAPASTPVVEPVDADGFTAHDLIAALDGRIDALSDEVRSLREKLDAPKGETRAAPETEAPKPAPAQASPAPVADAAGPVVVLAFALQRDLEAGRPFSEEIAAFSRLGAEPAPAPILIELADKGAPTGAQLRDSFLLVAKRIRAHDGHAETAHDNGDIAGHLLEGASKLVKVRPTGHPHPESLDGKLEQIEAALARSDFPAAKSLFDSLPDDAKAEAKDFGDALHQRLEAAKAADDLLHGAIAALGKK